MNYNNFCLLCLCFNSPQPALLWASCLAYPSALHSMCGLGTPPQVFTHPFGSCWAPAGPNSPSRLSVFSSSTFFSFFFILFLLFIYSCFYFSNIPQLHRHLRVSVTAFPVFRVLLLFDNPRYLGGYTFKYDLLDHSQFSAADSNCLEEVPGFFHNVSSCIQ